MYNNKFSLNNIIASIILGLSAIILISLLWIWVIKVPKTDRIPGKITIELHSDSTLVMSAEDRTVIIDSLNTIMQRREQLLANKYQYVIEKRAIEDSLFSIGSILVGIIIAILGFFGFKSFQAIEDKAHKIAEGTAKTTAKTTAETTAKTEAQNYLSKNIRSNIYSAIQKDFLDDIKRCIAASLKDDITPQLRKEMSDIADSIESQLREEILELISHSDKQVVDKENMVDSIPSNDLSTVTATTEDKI